MDSLSDTGPMGGSVEAKADCGHGNLRHSDRNRVTALYKNLVRYDNITRACNSRNGSNISNIMVCTRKTKVSDTWSVYKVLIPAIRPRKLSCMADGSQVVSTTLDTKAKLREMQDLETDIQNFIANEKPFDRIKRTLTLDVNTGEPSEQMVRIKGLAKVTVFSLLFFGGLKGYIEGQTQYKELTRFTMFASKGAAIKKRNNFIMKAVLNDGMRFVFKAGIFMFSVFFFYQCLEIYVNKTTPLTFSFACGLGGSLSRISLGPKGMFSGFVLGAVLGLLGGCLTYCGTKMTNQTQEELNYQLVKDKIIARRQFQRKETEKVTEYHEEVDEMD